jgi:hypothetical protein
VACPSLRFSFPEVWENSHSRRSSFWGLGQGDRATICRYGESTEFRTARRRAKIHRVGAGRTLLHRIGVLHKFLHAPEGEHQRCMAIWKTSERTLSTVAGQNDLPPYLHAGDLFSLTEFLQHAGITDNKENIGDLLAFDVKAIVLIGGGYVSKTWRYVEFEVGSVGDPRFRCDLLTDSWLRRLAPVGKFLALYVFAMVFRNVAVRETKSQFHSLYKQRAKIQLWSTAYSA